MGRGHRRREVRGGGDGRLPELGERSPRPELEGLLDRLDDNATIGRLLDPRRVVLERRLDEFSPVHHIGALDAEPVDVHLPAARTEARGVGVAATGPGPAGFRAPAPQQATACDALGSLTLAPVLLPLGGWCMGERGYGRQVAPGALLAQSGGPRTSH